MTERILPNKLLLLLAAAFLTFCTPGRVGAQEAEGAVVYGEPIEGAPGTHVELPVFIRNNPGLMGFSLVFHYDTEALNLTDVMPGEITSSGNLINSIGAQGEPGDVKVVWSNAEEIKKDGELLKLEFEIPDKTKKGEYNITIDYITEDTFNEKYEDIPINSQELSIEVSKGASGYESRHNEEDNHITTKNNKTFLIILAAAIAALLAATAVIAAVCVRKSKLKKKQQEKQDNNIGKPVNHKPAPTGCLRGISGSAAGFTIKVEDNEEIIIGKDPQLAHIIIEERYADISRKHCSIRYNAQNDLYEVTDLSENGTWLNDYSTVLPKGISIRVPRGSKLLLGQGKNIVSLE